MEENRSFVSKHLFELTFIAFKVAMWPTLKSRPMVTQYYDPAENPTTKEYMNFMYPYQHVQVMMFIGLLDDFPPQ